MAYLGKYKKAHLLELATELGETVDQSMKNVCLRQLIEKSPNYDEEYAKVMLDRFVEEEKERKEEEKERKEEEKRQLEERKEEEKRQLESERQERLEIQRMENERLEKERAYELEKLRLANRGVNNENSSDHDAILVKPNTDLQKLIRRFDLKESEISLYLVLFERQARRAKIAQEEWVCHLLGLLPYEITQIIAREPEEKANDYDHIKKLLLKRFKLSPEKFHQRFIFHQNLNSTWSDYAFELQNYFEEWISGLGIKDFQGLKDLMITDQMKRRVPAELKEHFIDEWTKFLTPKELADKLDEYETVRSNRSKPQVYERKQANNFNKSPNNTRSQRPGNFNNSKFKNQVPQVEANESNGGSGFRKPIRNEKGELKCFNCNYYGHISRDCPEKKKDSEKAVTNLITKTTSSSNALLYIKKAKVNKENFVDAMIDTGSSCCLMKKSVAEKLGMEFIPEVTDIYGFGNQIKPASKAIGKAVADIEIDDVVGKETAILLVSDESLPVDLLIGRTWLDLPHIAYARVGNELHIDEAPFSKLHTNLIKTRVTLKASEETVLERNTVNLVQCKSDEQNEGLLLIRDRQDGVDCLLEVKEGKVIVPVSNVRNENITLRKGQCVGRGEAVQFSPSEDDFMADEKCNPVSGTKLEENSFILDQVSAKTENAVSLKRPLTLEDIKTDENVTTEQKQQLLTLLNEYRDCVATNLSELGCTDLVTMEIKEVEGSKPVSMRPYRTNAEERAIIKEIVKEWKENGVVSETRSPYASPVMVVKKKTGDHRLVVDYRKLNLQTVKDKYPLPRIDDLFESLNNCQVFTTLDLAHGYLQIPLSESAKEKTAFITPDETGQFERMIFGLTNAPAEFQRMMHLALGPLLDKEVLCYLDDILVPAKTWTEMMDKLKLVLERLKSAHLTLKLSKCEFGKEEIEFLGFVVNKNGIQPGRRKTSAVAQFPIPKNVHEVRRYLGLTSFFRRFIPNYALLAEPLTRLTRKDVVFQWKEEQQLAFDKLKEDLIKHPTLALYNPSARTEVHTDASCDGIAGMLLQYGDDGQLHLVYCVSKKTTTAESKYHSSKLELMAIVWTLERLRQFLLGISFTVVTDCQALIYMNAKKSNNPQIARWSLFIQEYDFEIRHRPGAKMSHVDAISRAPVLNASDTLGSLIENTLEVFLTLSVEDQVLMMQHSDDALKELIEILKKDVEERTKEENHKVENYVLTGNRLFRVTKEGDKERLLFVIPKSMRESIVVKFHDLMGHFAVDRTVSKIKELYWFPSMKRYVRRHISMCFECLVNKVPGGKRQGLLHPVPTGKRPFSTIHLDHLGPFVTSSKRNKELLVVVDNMTRFVRLYPVKDTSSKNVLKSVKDFVEEFGLPDRVISDRGSCFTSRDFQDFCNENGISHTLNSTSHPQANGMVERTNRTILSTIVTSMENINQKDWDSKIKEVERNLNNTVNKTLGKTPFEVLHGYVPRFKDGILRLFAAEEADVWNEPEKLQHEARQGIERQQEKTKAFYDKKKSGTLSFDKGEVVVVRRHPKATGESTKTQSRYRGPMVITEVLPSDTYRISQLEATNGRMYATTAHVSQLKAWRGWDEDEDDLSDDDNSGEELVNQRPKRTTREPQRYQ